MKKIINPWIRLENEGYNCFGCAPHNPYGLKMEFYEDGDDIVSFWTPTDNYQGWLHTLHGGMCAAVLDQAMGVVAYSLKTEDGTCPTVQMEVEYHRPLIPGEGILVKVRVISMTKSLINLTAEAFRASRQDKICLSGSGIFFRKPADPEKARD